MVRETRHLWVGNLPENIREDRIFDHFKRYASHRWSGRVFTDHWPNHWLVITFYCLCCPEMQFYSIEWNSTFGLHFKWVDWKSTAIRLSLIWQVFAILGMCDHLIYDLSSGHSALAINESTLSSHMDCLRQSVPVCASDKYYGETVLWLESAANWW